MFRYEAFFFYRRRQASVFLAEKKQRKATQSLIVLLVIIKNEVGSVSFFVRCNNQLIINDTHTFESFFPDSHDNAHRNL
jgi:hypothetical protein